MKINKWILWTHFIYWNRERYPGTISPKSERCRELLKFSLFRKRLALNIWTFEQLSKISKTFKKLGNVVKATLDFTMMFLKCKLNTFVMANLLKHIINVVNSCNKFNCWAWNLKLLFVGSFKTPQKQIWSKYFLLHQQYYQLVQYAFSLKRRNSTVPLAHPRAASSTCKVP